MAQKRRISEGCLQNHKCFGGRGKGTLSHGRAGRKPWEQSDRRSKKKKEDSFLHSEQLNCEGYGDTTFTRQFHGNSWSISSSVAMVQHPFWGVCNLWRYEDISWFSPPNSPWIYPVHNKISLSIHCWWLHPEPLVRSVTALRSWCATGSLYHWGSPSFSALSLSWWLSQWVFKIKDSLLARTVSTWQTGMSILFRVYKYCQYNLKITITNFGGFLSHYACTGNGHSVPGNLSEN